MRLIFSYLLSALACANAEASDGKKAALIRTHGYVSPQFQAVWRPDARPVDQSRIGMTKSKAGLIFDGKVSAHWGFKIHFVVGGETFSALTHARPVDENNDGSTDSVHTESEETIGDMVVESTVTYRPIRALQVQLGRMRIPFTSQAQSPNTDLMFPERSGPNQAFIKALTGALVVRPFDGRLKGSVGVFNGTSTNALKTNRQGILYPHDYVNPLGDFGFQNLGVGRTLPGWSRGWAIHNPYTVTMARATPSSVTDTRTSIGGRRPSRFYLAAEFSRACGQHVRTSSLGIRLVRSGGLAPTDGTRANVPDGHRDHR